MLRLVITGDSGEVGVFAIRTNELTVSATCSIDSCGAVRKLTRFGTAFLTAFFAVLMIHSVLS